MRHPRTMLELVSRTLADASSQNLLELVLCNLVDAPSQNRFRTHFAHFGRLAILE
jgi:hypothetical protein